MGLGNTLQRVGLVSILVLGVVSGFSSVSFAEVSAKDMDVIAKAIEFISNGPSGDVKVDIIYDSSNPASVADANAAAAMLASGVSSGKVKLTGKKVEGPSGGKVAYIAKGAESKASALNAKKVITVSADPECARSGQCVLGVTSSPKVEIHVSSAAAKSAGVEFGSAFRMMITEH
jgi:hypothetical protein